MSNLIYIPDSYDTSLQKTFIREYSARHFPLVDLVRMDRQQTFVDPLYNEAPARRFEDPVPIRCLPDHQPTKKTLTSFGIEQSRSVLFKVPTIALADIDYLRKDETWMIGDLIKWGNDYYEILDQVKVNDGYWATTNIPMYLVLGADYYRHGV